MDPNFSKAVDPIFIGVIDLLDRIGYGKAEAPERERAHIKGMIDRAETLLGNKDEWKLAKYALVCWVDAALIDAPWDVDRWWDDHVLEREYFFDRVAFSEFYVRAQKAMQLSSKNALEVYYICVVLGFRGMFADASSAEHAEKLGVSKTLESWARETVASLHLGVGRPPILEQPKKVDGAPPLTGYTNLIITIIFTLTAIAIPLGYYLKEFFE